MKHSLRFKLTGAFLLISLVSFSLIGLFANIILQKQFENYVISNLDSKRKDIVTTLEGRYSAWGGNWDSNGLESFGVSALSDGMILRISNKDGGVLWDAMTHNSGLCAEMLKTMAQNMEKQHSGFIGGYTEKNYRLAVDGVTVGNVTIGYYGPYFYTDNDINYLNTLNKLLLLAAAFACILSFFLGYFMAKHLTKPISRVIRTSEQISEGNFNVRVNEVSSTTEIVELTYAVNTLAEALGEQERLRKRLTADVAHELRTPIANLQSHLEAMIDGIWEASPERLKSCNEETIRLTKIVSDLSTLARYDGEIVTLNKECFDLSELIKSIEASFEKEFADKSISFETDVQTQYINADRDKIAQIIVNLIANALKYTSGGGKVKIIAAEENREVKISIKDTGIGISKEDLPYIFERFYRADKSRSRESGGSGIGLAIVKSLVEAHGGSISVKSEQGIGSEFVIVMPI